MVRGWRSPHPLPTCKPAGVGEEVNNLAGGAWRGVEEKNWFLFSFFIQEVCFQSIVIPGVVGPAWTSFWLRLNEGRHLDERESFVF